MHDDLPFDRIIVAHPEMAGKFTRAIADAGFPAGPKVEQAELFRRDPGEGECRICGRWGELTREHTPPRAAFNSQKSRGSGLLDWLATEGLEVPTTGPHLQGGVWGYSLCADCNSATGRYAPEYGVWARGAAQLMIDTANALAPEDLNDLDVWVYRNVRLVDVFPARFARQALTQVLVVSGSSDLSRREPILRDLVLGGDPAPLPAGMALFLTLYGGPNARYAGGPYGQGLYREDTGWTHAIEVAYPPFAVQMILKGSTERAAGIDLSQLTELGVDDRRSFNLEELMIGFGNTPFPLDYRPRGMVLKQGGPPES